MPKEIALTRANDLAAILLWTQKLPCMISLKIITVCHIHILLSIVLDFFFFHGVCILSAIHFPCTLLTGVV